MQIKVVRHQLLLGTSTFYDMTVTSDNTVLSEYRMEEDEVFKIAIDLFQNTVLDNSWKEEIVGKLIEVGILTHEQIVEYLEECGQE